MTDAPAGLAPKHAAFAIAALATAALDRIAKACVVHAIEPGSSVDVVRGFFSITHVRNPGAAFGFLASSSPELRGMLFATAAAAALLVILVHLRAVARGERREPVALGLVAGGAVGNAIDRLFRGAVVDLFHFHWGDFSWYVFNLADAAIVAGVAGLLYDSFLGGHNRAQNPG